MAKGVDVKEGITSSVLRLPCARWDLPDDLCEDCWHYFFCMQFAEANIRKERSPFKGRSPRISNVSVPLGTLISTVSDLTHKSLSNGGIDGHLS